VATPKTSNQANEQKSPNRRTRGRATERKPMYIAFLIKKTNVCCFHYGKEANDYFCIHE
jgi:hypothetical protein